MRIYNILRRFYKDLPELPNPRQLRLKGDHDYHWKPPYDHFVFLNPIERRNVWHRIGPERWRGYLIRLYKKAVYERKKALQHEKDKAKAANRHPPTNVRRNGRLIKWDPPGKGETPECYWVEELMSDGNWTRLQPPIYPGKVLARRIYGDGAARVAAYYSNEPMSLGWGFRYSDIMEGNND